MCDGLCMLVASFCCRASELCGLHAAVYENRGPLSMGTARSTKVSDGFPITQQYDDFPLREGSQAYSPPQNRTMNGFPITERLFLKGGVTSQFSCGKVIT